MIKSRYKRRAFTLIELLLVVAIISVVAGITLPSFFRSMRGNRLRASARTVVMMGRYARSMALLKQQEYVLKIDLNAAKVSLHPVPSTYVRETATSNTEHLLMDETEAKDKDAKTDEEDDPDKVTTGLGEEELSRTLDQVRVEYVELGKDKDRVSEGSCQIMYRSNGTCTQYRVRIADEDGDAIIVKVDMLSSAETERD